MVVVAISWVGAGSALQAAQVAGATPAEEKKKMPCYPCSRLPAAGIEVSIRPPDGAGRGSQEENGIAR